MSKCYSECIMLKTFEERFNYLKLNGIIGEETFGFQRYINQKFYHSKEWQSFKQQIIIRDNGCDLALEGYDIRNEILIHHINPISVKDIVDLNKKVFDPENVIVTCLITHNALHYGNESILKFNRLVERSKGDTKLW